MKELSQKFKTDPNTIAGKIRKPVNRTRNRGSDELTSLFDSANYQYAVSELTDNERDYVQNLFTLLSRMYPNISELRSALCKGGEIFSDPEVQGDEKILKTMLLTSAINLRV